MRPGLALALAFALVLLSPAVLAQTEAPARATLTVQARDDGSETGTLRFDGLRRLTEYQGLCLPARASPTRVYDELGDLAYQQRAEEGRTTVAFRARGAWAAIELVRTAPTGIERPLVALDTNFCVPAGGSVRVEVEVPDGARLFFLSDGGRVEGGRGVVDASGPTHVFYTFESATLPAGTTVFDEGPFRVFAPTSRLAEAEEVARAAAPAYLAALDEAGLTSPFDAVRVVYGPISATPWEAGHYTGHGYVTVRVDSLDPDPQKGYPFVPTKLLVHEGFHAASFPYGRGPVNDTISWWLEGTARHAERQVDALLPNASYHCEKSATEVRCWDFDDRIRRVDVETGYADDFTFDTRWEPALEQTDDTRRFYYAWSEFLVGALIEQHGEATYRAIWDEIEAAFATGAGCPCDEGWLFEVLEAQTGATRGEVLRPWDDVRERAPAQFEATVKPLVKDEQRERERLESMRPGPFDVLTAPGPFALAPALALVLALAFARRRR